ncbi:hypothetical protein [Paenibacillus xanthanilyticus]|uniref:Uncharacterized protein n=1 Tax=Paenibacillus xanthanilyticus TaxID=1783531 RepID=A0ABV8KA45_9BACL
MRNKRPILNQEVERQCGRPSKEASSTFLSPEEIEARYGPVNVSPKKTSGLVGLEMSTQAKQARERIKARNEKAKAEGYKQWTKITRPDGSKLTVQRDEVLRLLQQGKKLADIEEHYKLMPGRFGAVMQRFGIKYSEYPQSKDRKPVRK